MDTGGSGGSGVLVEDQGGTRGTDQDVLAEGQVRAGGTDQVGAGGYVVLAESQGGARGTDQGGSSVARVEQAEQET